jgi:choline dehydrogenase-like flavoprotein
MSGLTSCRIAALALAAALKQGLKDEFLAPNGFWEIEGEPYVSAPGSRFRWFRSRIVGGRTNHWGRIALRYAPVDFSRARATAWGMIGRSPTRT